MVIPSHLLSLHSVRDDLELLGVKPAERRKLEAMGITTLEQLAQMMRHELGLGKQRGDDIITAAQNILDNRHIQEVEIKGEVVSIKLNRVSQGVQAAVKAVSGAYESTCDSRLVGDSLVLTPTSRGDPRSFQYVVERVRKWGDIMAAKQEQGLHQIGVTILEPRSISVLPSPQAQGHT